MEKVKELIKQEFEANDEKVVQIVKDPPLPKKVLPLFRIPLKGEPKAMSISSDSIFIGLQTGEIQIISLSQEQKQCSWQAHDFGIERIQVSKYNEVVVTAVATEIKLWMLGDQQQYQEKASIVLPKNLEKLTFALNEQGSFLAIGSSNNSSNNIKHKLHL